MTREQARRAADLYRALAELHAEVAGEPPSNAAPMPKPKQRRMSKVKPLGRELTAEEKAKRPDVMRHAGLMDPRNG